MALYAYGINHKTAPLSLREQLAPTDTMLANDLQQITLLPNVQEAVILSTCNRTEIYCDTNHTQTILHWLAETRGFSPNTLSPHFYAHRLPEQGVRHAIRVASGLDSMMLGEPQIFGQMKQACQKAREAGTLGQKLQPIFDFIFNASKRVRTDSGLGQNPTSIAFAAVQLIHQFFTALPERRVFIIGSGDTANLVATYLSKKGIKNFIIANRSIENAERLAQTLQGRAVSVNDIGEQLPHVDIVITATSCPLPFVSAKMVEQAMQHRENAPLFFLDLSVPRDVEPSVAKIPNVHLYNVDDLQTIVQYGLAERQQAAMTAEQLIQTEIERFTSWYRTIEAKHTICAYREHVKTLASAELAHFQKKQSTTEHENALLQAFSERLLDKIMHGPTVGLRNAAATGRTELLDFVDYLLSSNETIN